LVLENFLKITRTINWQILSIRLLSGNQKRSPGRCQQKTHFIAIPSGSFYTAGKHAVPEFCDHYVYVSLSPEQPHMGDISDDPRLRERTFVFFDRHDAGRQLGAFIKTFPAVRDPLVLAIPAGGVPIGKEVAVALGAPLSLAIVRKIRIPGSTESGFGAVTWDGQVLINERLRAALGLSAHQVDVAIAETRKNVSERIARFTGGRAVPAMAGKTVIITDDGLASGFTMLAAVKSIRSYRPARITVAVPTASASSAELVSRQAVCCCRCI
jgi:predicted phosphoribosyltransferase